MLTHSNKANPMANAVLGCIFDQRTPKEKMLMAGVTIILLDWFLKLDIRRQQTIHMLPYDALCTQQAMLSFQFHVEF